MHFETKNIARDKKGHFIMINEKIHQEDLIILSVYATNNDLRINKANILQNQRKYKLQKHSRNFYTSLSI